MRPFRDPWTRLRPIVGPLQSLADTICPPTCPGCRDCLLDAGQNLCANCTAAVGDSLAAPYCVRCGHTTGPFPAASGCPQCRRERFVFDGVIRGGAYTGRWASLLKRLKYQGAEELLVPLARPLVRQILVSAEYEALDALVTVPTNLARRLVRPVHLAARLAEHLRRACDLPAAPLLARRQGGRHQTGLPLATRRTNVRGCFRLAPGCRIAGARLLLVDDVMTSGATASECARVLKRAGALRVHVAVLARAAEDPLTTRQA